MKITHLDTVVVDFYRTNLIFVRLTTDEGLTGIAEATLEGQEHAVLGAVAVLAEAVRGKDPTRITQTIYELNRDAYWRGGPVSMTALSALEMAMWDVSARALGVPVHRMLGGQVRDRVRAYANGWFSGAITPEAFAEAAVRTVGQGFRGLKWDPFEAADLFLEPRDLGRMLEPVEAVRAAVGDDVELFIEGHGRFDVPTAIRVARELERFQPVFFEEPCPPDGIDALVEVRSKSPVPIAAGERWMGRNTFIPALARNAVDYIQPDVTHAGGLLELSFISTLAAAHYVPFAPHNPSGPLSTAATLQLGATLPNFRYLEIMATDVPWRSDISSERLQLTADGDVMIPEGAGLGIDLDYDAIAEHPFTPHPMRIFSDVVADIRPPDARSYFNLAGAGVR
ncbi:MULTISPECIES: mandelate racemase/muconate lactonizing enzyme family protein [Micrococcaceae]|uniref:mandelate racemase/muconate lactonizing enzyme family protein n=1 Tax=Micrococcaceae TaxID=1268 RepID=UPI0006FF294F|nr:MULTISPECIES: mandelate racemase/muconate lactonizing enzyme family protein [unclassified Arthrobacter]KRE75179.1 mandelate racemase [Arthrobacter sp. Soil761]TWD48045.1 galactonate dehydratase [Arthrobacter sp. AG367]